MGLAGEAKRSELLGRAGGEGGGRGRRWGLVVPGREVAMFRLDFFSLSFLSMDERG